MLCVSFRNLCFARSFRVVVTSSTFFLPRGPEDDTSRSIQTMSARKKAMVIVRQHVMFFYEADRGGNFEIDFDEVRAHFSPDRGSPHTLPSLVMFSPFFLPPCAPRPSVCQ